MSAQHHLVHYSSKPLTTMLNVCPMSDVMGNLVGKPRGLYLSPGEAWADWARGQSVGLDIGEYKYRVALKPEAKLYVVDDEAAVLALDDMIGEQEYQNWAALAAAGYDGIEVRNYSALRMASLCTLPTARPNSYVRFLWLYAMDVDCVCLWNAATAVATFEHVPLISTEANFSCP